MSVTSPKENSPQDMGFFRRWLFSTNHKDIGVLYLFASGLIGLIAVILSVKPRSSGVVILN